MDAATARRAERIRLAVKGLGKRGPGRRYPEALKREVLAYLAERRKVGRGPATVAVELGIPERSVKLWSEAPRPSGAPTFVAMSVGTAANDASVPRIVVHGPTGVRVDGLDVAALADLLRRLA
jgi:hypothetical protein